MSRKKIELIALHPNATHIYQPLDVAFFHPLKEAYKVAVNNYKLEKNTIDLKKYMVPAILQKAIESRNFEEGIRSGFKSSGLFPFDANALNYDVLNKKPKRKKSINTGNTRSLSNTDEFNFLNHFENNCISASTLKIFKANERETLWTGDPTLTALFETWQKMRGQCGTFNFT